MSALTWWIIAEPNASGMTNATKELISEAVRQGGDVSVVTWGDTSVELVDGAGRYGARAVLQLDVSTGFVPGAPVAAAVAALCAARSPDVILLPSSYDGRDIAGHLSARLDRPVLTNVTALSVDDDVVTQHQIFGGTKIASARITSDGVALIVVRPKSFTAVEKPRDVTLERIDAAPSPVTPVVITESHLDERTGPALGDADVVVAGGRGLGGVEAFANVATLATLLGGAPAASRAIVDAGWVPYAYQVGQTGQTVKPTLYVACGISGATQHLVGMKGAQYIVAINKDAAAPIFSVADFGIVGDVNTVLPALNALVRSRTA
jgi:electron transfer flavoprotein alpha subunit